MEDIGKVQEAAYEQAAEAVGAVDYWEPLASVKVYETSAELAAEITEAAMVVAAALG